MTSATSVGAAAVGTIEWLAESSTSIVVPVYQRQYRWDIGGCEQLLADIRQVAAQDASHRHFIGSILSAPNAEESGLILIDGQQRLTTLMLLIAALHHSVRESDPALAAELWRVLVRADDPTRTKLRPHDAWAGLFEAVVLGQDGGATQSRFADNYAFFRSQVQPGEASRIWEGLRKLEHISITLGVAASAQQIFESLNSTGEPLRDHELIHNYVLMGLSHAEQQLVEQEYWLPIERNTGESIGAFWRHYLIQVTGREVLVDGEHGVYSAFRHRFAHAGFEALCAQAAQWREYSEVYRALLDPTQEPDAMIRRHLVGVNTFGRGTYPLVLAVHREYRAGALPASELITTLELVQSMLLRRTVVGVPTERLAARLCRARTEGPAELERAIARITPSDERVSIVLRYGEVPNAPYVLGRLAGIDEVAGLDVEHIAPLVPGESWSGDGERVWGDLSADEQNSYRALAPTLGNLTLLEEPLAMRVFGASFADKRGAYQRSQVADTRAVAERDCWGTAEIARRTAELTDRFVQVWRRPAPKVIDDDGLTPILDAVRRRGWPAGWNREFEYVEYRGERWEVHDVRALFHRVFHRAWADTREAVLEYSSTGGGPIYPAMAWNGQWDRLDDEHFLYLGWDSKYLMAAVQGLLDASGLAPEVFVKYSYIGNVM
ncbi:MAG TPA: DUF262 domain-containing protein [Candidatus Lumbricidophila sp.]|nr:DUF262 domain-containing protein [Candidatus Lumbricidophila sp.]